MARAGRVPSPTDRAGAPEGSGVQAETVRRLERATGALGTAAMAAMDERLPWFAAMSAENRSWLGLVAQAGIAAFVNWVKHPERARPAVTGEVFGTAPRELARAISLQQAVEMVRVVVRRGRGPEWTSWLRRAATPTQGRPCSGYTQGDRVRRGPGRRDRAEARGAWDARLEALVVNSLVRGEGSEERPAVLGVGAGAGHPPRSPVIAGQAEGDNAEQVSR